MRWITRKLVVASLLAGLAGLPLARAAENAPSFQEVYDVLKAHLVGVDDAKLDQAAVEGLLKQLAPRVALVTNGSAAPKVEGPALSKSEVYDGSFGYLRVARVETGLAKELGSALDRLAGTNTIKGWVLDLRFADGLDYQAATEAAGPFVAGEQPLLDWGQGMTRSKTNENAIKVPVMVLVNRETSRAAEALAGVLRETEAALLLGTNTAGRAFISQEFPLKNGQRLRLATALIKLGRGEALPIQGVKPDILVAVNPDHEKAYFQDAFKVLSVPSLVRTAHGGDTNLTATTTNKPRHRLNEAELVRMLREGEDIEDEGRLTPAAEPDKPVLRDPALARALDLLKGLAVVRRAK